MPDWSRFKEYERETMRIINVEFHYVRKKRKALVAGRGDRIYLFIYLYRWDIYGLGVFGLVSDL